MNDLNEIVRQRLQNGEKQVWLEAQGKRRGDFVCVVGENASSPGFFDVFKWGSERIIDGLASDFNSPPFDRTQFRNAFVPSILNSFAGFVLADDVPESIRMACPEQGVKRAMYDTEAHFGDGGYAILSFPIYKRDLTLSEDVRAGLFAALNALPDDKQVY